MSADNSLLRQLGLTGDAQRSRQVLFRKCDVSVWTDIVALFEDAWKRFGRIDAVVSNAGVNNEDFLTSVIDASTGLLSPPDLKPLEINLTGKSNNEFFSGSNAKITV